LRHAYGSKSAMHSSAASLASVGDATAAASEFLGLFDVTMVAAWFVSCCPENMITVRGAPLELEAASAAAADKGTNDSSGTCTEKGPRQEDKERGGPKGVTITPSSSSSSRGLKGDIESKNALAVRAAAHSQAYYKKIGQQGTVQLHDLVHIMHVVDTFPAHARQKVAELWSKTGIRAASASVREVLFDADAPLFPHRPRIQQPRQFLSLDTSLYNVVELFAEGHKGVPLCTDPVRPGRVTHVVDAVCLTSFLYRHDVEFFSAALFLPALEMPLVRAPCVVPASYVLCSIFLPFFLVHGLFVSLIHILLSASLF
jgi:hypothetical protein